MGQLWGWREQVYLPSTWQTSGLGAWIRSRLVGSGGKGVGGPSGTAASDSCLSSCPFWAGSGLYPGLGFWDLPEGYDYTGSQTAGSPGQGLALAYLAYSKVLPCSLVKLESKATRQEKMAPLRCDSELSCSSGSPWPVHSLSRWGALL